MANRAALYEINAYLLARRLGTGRSYTLAAIPTEYWTMLRHLGFRYVWLMGVWQRSSAAREQALTHPDLIPQYRQTLPDYDDDDVVASPYAILDYRVDESLGGNTALQRVRAQMLDADLQLIVDFVPNHLARDHHWSADHPERFVRATDEAATRHPDWFFAPRADRPGVRLAHGKDPNFPPWTDTVQINFFHRELRQALIEELLTVAEHADGVRCDMAMLALNDVFARCWGWLNPGPRPTAEFWREAIAAVRARHPNFVFIAEAYWGHEAELITLGFDYVYDRTLYDRLLQENAAAVLAHLHGMGEQLDHYTHFIENHDERRAARAFGRERARAAAVVTATIPGLQLVFDGQLEGRGVHLPIQLARAPHELVDDEMMGFYRRLLPACARFAEGEWTLLAVHSAWEENQSHRHMLAWQWQRGADRQVIVINYSSHPAQGRLLLPGDRDGNIDLRDLLSDQVFARDGEELRTVGLYVALPAWGAHLFEL